MRQELALWTEWAWAEGLLEARASGRASVIAFAHLVFATVSRRYPGAAGARARGVEQLTDDIQSILRRLAYGGREARSLHPLRREFLSRLTLQGVPRTILATHKSKL